MPDALPISPPLAAAIDDYLRHADAVTMFDVLSLFIAVEDITLHAAMI